MSVVRRSELLDHIEGFEEVDTSRIAGIDAYIKENRGRGVIYYKWHKYISPSGIGIYVRALDQPDATIDSVQLSFPDDFEDRYWETIGKLEKISGVSFEENHRSVSENPEHYEHNYDYLQEIGKLYATLPARVRQIVKENLKSEDMNNSGLHDPQVGYLDLTYNDTHQNLAGGENINLILAPPKHCYRCNEKEIQEISTAIDILDGMAEATTETWQSIEDATLAYARHLREVYQPILPNS